MKTVAQRHVGYAFFANRVSTLMELDDPLPTITGDFQLSRQWNGYILILKIIILGVTHNP
jgi:hypothetical protein